MLCLRHLTRDWTSLYKDLLFSWKHSQTRILYLEKINSSFLCLPVHLHRLIRSLVTLYTNLFPAKRTNTFWFKILPNRMRIWLKISNLFAERQWLSDYNITNKQTNKKHERIIESRIRKWLTLKGILKTVELQAPAMSRAATY